MTERPEKVVVDAGVLIAFLNREEGRYDRSRELLEDAEDEHIELWAPMVILVEVARWSREVDPADPGAREKLEEFLESDWLNVAEVDRRMSRIARDVVAHTSVRTGIDALYVATAILLELPAVFAWDERVISVEYEGVRGMEPPGSRTPKLELPSPSEVQAEHEVQDEKAVAVPQSARDDDAEEGAEDAAEDSDGNT